MRTEKPDRLTQKLEKSIMKMPGSQEGFTLVELLVTIGIIGILAAVVISAISSTIPKYQLRAAAREVVVDFKKAKAEAVKRNRSVLVEFTPATVGGSYLICVDSNKSSSCDVNDPVLRSVTLTQNVRLVSTTFTSNRTGFTNRGLVLGGNNGSLTLQNRHGSRSQVITLSGAGNGQLQ